MSGHIQTSNSIEWCTPQPIADLVNTFFSPHVHLDPCSNSHSLIKAENSWTFPEHNGLVEPWSCGLCRTVYVNPPFGRSYYQGNKMIGAKEYKDLLEGERTKYQKQTILSWVKKIERESRANNLLVLALLPCSTDTEVWQEHIFKSATCVCWIKGRLKFLREGQSTGPCPMPCSLVFWGNPGEMTTLYKNGFIRIFQHIGKITIL